MRHLIRKRNFQIGALFAAVLAGLLIGQLLIGRSGRALAQNLMAPRYEVDPQWPKPLPNHWILGSVVGVSVDADDHVWIIHRGASTLTTQERAADLHAGICCSPAPPVLEFDQAGNLLRHWGGPGEGYEWPDSNHGIFIDYKGNVWIGGDGGPDSQILKFTKDGKFLVQIGKKGARRKAGAGTGEGQVAGFAGDSNDLLNFGGAAKIFVDQKENEAYIADGTLNKRVAVLDADTGKMKRYWGAYGNKPDDTPLPAYDRTAVSGTPSSNHIQQFRNPVHCAEMSVDRLIYVCDSENDRLQVFTPDGKFIKEAYFHIGTRDDGSVGDVAFSKDPEQKFIFLVDGVNDRVRILDRQSLTELTNFGDGGRMPGQFNAVDSIATDHEGNIYTAETYEGKRVQRFVLKGMSPVTKMDQGIVWAAPSR